MSNCYLNKNRYNSIYIKKFKRRDSMNIIVNGENRTFTDSVNLANILEELSLVGKVMAAAVNMEIVKQDSWDTYMLKDGDKLELLDFVGGG